MSERAKRMLRVLNQAFYERHEAEACVSLADRLVLEVVAAEIDDLANNPRGDLFAGILIGKMEADDTGYLFGRMTESICGTVMAPSFLGIEALLTGLRKMWAEGWRLVPPKTYGKQPKTVEEMTEYLREDLEEASEISRACAEGSLPRLRARKFGPRAQTETKEQAPESAAEQNKQLDEAYRRLYAGVVGRPGIAGALQVQPEDLPEESK